MTKQAKVDETILNLTTIAANLVVLAMKARNAHWNVIGPQFATMHVFFEERYEEIESAIDEVAERIRVLGAPAPGMLADFLHHATIKERPGSLQSAGRLLDELHTDFESLIATLRYYLRSVNGTEDLGTAEVLTGIMASMEKSAWMIQAHLESA